jgi:hypothetical protein
VSSRSSDLAGDGSLFDSSQDSIGDNGERPWPSARPLCRFMLKAVRGTYSLF